MNFVSNNCPICTKPLIDRINNFVCPDKCYIYYNGAKMFGKIWQEASIMVYYPYKLAHLKDDNNIEKTVIFNINLLYGNQDAQIKLCEIPPCEWNWSNSKEVIHKIKMLTTFL